MTIGMVFASDGREQYRLERVGKWGLFACSRKTPEQIRLGKVEVHLKRNLKRGKAFCTYWNPRLMVKAIFIEGKIDRVRCF